MFPETKEHMSVNSPGAFIRTVLKRHRARAYTVGEGERDVRVRSVGARSCALYENTIFELSMSLKSICLY